MSSSRMERNRLPLRFTIPNDKKPDIRQLCLDVDEEIYRSYSGPCMIPGVDSDEFRETGEMSNCHVIGRQFLELIARYGRILAWPFNGRQISHAILPAVWNVTNTILPEVASLQPEPIGVNSYPCISRFACHGHDDTVFKQIDSPATFVRQLEEHQFLLAFWSIAGATAITEGALTYITDEIRRQMPRRVRRQRSGVTINHLRILEHSMSISQERAEILRGELKAWQSMYVADSQRSILSWHTTAATKVRLTVSSVVHTPEGFPVIASVLPRFSGEPQDNLCDIILSSRKTRLIGTEEAEQQGHLQEQTVQLTDFAQQLVEVLAKDPADGIPALVKSLSLNPTSFFFVSTEDYQSISEEGREHIEREMAEVAQGLLSI